MAEDVVTVPASLLHALARLQLRQNPRQEPCRIQQFEPALHPLRQQEFRELVADTFHRDGRRLQPSGMFANRGLSGLVQRELQPRREPHSAQHPQRVFIERCVWIYRRYDPPRLQVLEAVSSEVEDRPVPIHQQCVDGEITASNVIVQAPWVDMRLATR